MQVCLRSQHLTLLLAIVLAAISDKSSCALGFALRSTQSVSTMPEVPDVGLTSADTNANANSKDSGRVFHVVPGEVVQYSDLNKRPTPVPCTQSDPEPAAQPSPPSPRELQANFGCVWRWVCFKDESRYPPTWLEAVLVSPDKPCSCRRNPNRQGTCQLAYAQTAALRKAGRDPTTGEHQWRVSSEPFAVAASCHFADDKN